MTWGVSYPPGRRPPSRSHLEGSAPLAPSSKEGCGQGGEESILPKTPRRCLPPLGLSLSLISWRMGLLGLVPLAHIGQGAHPYSPCGPRGRWPHPVDPRDPFGGPGTIPVTPKLVPMAEIALLYIILYLRTIPELLVTFGISSGTPNNFRVSTYTYLYNPSVTEP